MKHNIAKQEGANFCAVQVGPLAKLDQYTFQHPRILRPARGKIFLKELLGTTGLEISLNKLPAGAGMPFFHSHVQNEEVYIFTSGTGEFMVDDARITIEPGTVIRVAPAGERTWRNNSKEDLYYVVIQARAGTIERSTIEDGVASNKPVKWEN